MEITKSECVKLLHNQFMPDVSQIDNVWLVMWSAWWENRDTCLSYFWNSIKLVKDDLVYCMETKDACPIEVVEQKKTPEKTENKFIAAVQSINFDNKRYDFLVSVYLCYLLL